MSILDAQRYAESMTRKEVADALKKGHPLVPGFLLADRAKQFQQNEALLKVLEEKANLPQPGQTITDKLQTYLQNSLSQERQELSPVQRQPGAQAARNDMPGQGAGEAMPGARMPAGAGGPMPGPTMPPGAGQAMNARRGGIVPFQNGGGLSPSDWLDEKLPWMSSEASASEDIWKRLLTAAVPMAGVYSGGKYAANALERAARQGKVRPALSKAARLGGRGLGLAALSELAFPEKLGGGDIPKLLRMEHRRASGGIVGLQNGGTPPGDYEGSGWGDAIGNWWNQSDDRRREAAEKRRRVMGIDRMRPGYEDPRSKEEQKEEFMDVAMGMFPMGTAGRVARTTGTAVGPYLGGGSAAAARPGQALSTGAEWWQRIPGLGGRRGLPQGIPTVQGVPVPPGAAARTPLALTAGAKTPWWKNWNFPWKRTIAGITGLGAMAHLFAPDDEEFEPQGPPNFSRRPAPKGDDTSRYQTLYDMIEGYEERARTPSEQERQGWKMDSERAGELNEYSDTIAGLRPTDEQYGRKRKAAGLAAFSRVAGRSGDPDEDQTFAQIADTLATEGTRQRGEKLGFENMLADIASQRYGVERGSLREQATRQRSGDAWWQPMVGAKQSEIEQMFALDQARINAAADQNPYAPEHLGKWIDLLEDNVVTGTLSPETIEFIKSNIARVARGGRAMGDGSEVAQLLALMDRAEPATASTRQYGPVARRAPTTSGYSPDYEDYRSGPF